MNNIFGVYCKAKIALANDGHVLVKEDEGFWVAIEHGGWVPATSRKAPEDQPAASIKTWESIEEANAFMKIWKGHPWYYVPKTWKVVPLKIITKEVFSHYETEG